MKFLFRVLLSLSCVLYSALLFAQSPTSSTEERIYGLSKLWQEANYNFAYFDNVPRLNFDSLYQAYLPKVMAAESDYAYYRLLQRFCASLRDGHTYVMLPKHLQQQIVTPQVEFTRIDGQVYITNTGLQYKAQIPLGSKVLEVDGRGTQAYLDEAVYPYFTASTEHVRLNLGAQALLKGLAGTTASLKIQKPNKQISTVRITRNKHQEEWVKPVQSSSALTEFKMLKGGIGLLRLNSFGKQEVVDQFKQLLPQIRKSKGLIIDLRTNGGGMSSAAFAIVKYFTEANSFVTLASATRKHLADRKATGALADTLLSNYFGVPPFAVDSTYAAYLQGKVWEQEPLDSVRNDVHEPKLLMPLVILTSNRTVSAAEDFLIALDNVNRGIRVGQPTKGSTGQPLFVKMPGGGWAAICSRRNTYPDGRKFVGVGILPHVAVEVSFDDHFSHKDGTLAKGIEVLKKEMRMQN